MVFFNYATMQMAAKIVYYGPGLCGKTTNLHYIYGKTAPTSRGEMISLETETDRTLFFDLLPIDVGIIGGFKTRLQLYTVPGQVFYNTTRKLVLRGVDGIVFVADSQRAMKDANVESFQNMETNLQEIGLTHKDIPLVMQFNKRDLSTILTLDELLESLDSARQFTYFEASAIKGDGVFETLKEISKHTLRSLKKKMMGEEKAPSRPSLPKAAAAPPAVSPAPAAAVEPPSAKTKPPPPPPLREPEPSISLSDLRADAEAAASELAAQLDSGSVFAEAESAEEIEPLEAEEARPTRESVRRTAAKETLPEEAPPEEAEFIAEAEEAPAPAEAAEEPLAAEAPEEAVTVDFAQAAVSTPVDIVKHVKVRSNVDILSELEKLRKNATLKPLPEPAPSAARRTSEGVSIDDLLAAGLNHRKEVQRLFEIEMRKKELARARRLKFIVRLEDDKEKTIGNEKAYDIELANMKEVEKLLVSLKLHLSGR
jgi:signal recognition particle receptor subunit beta